MKLKKLFTAFYSFIIILLLALAALSIYVFQNQNKMVENQEKLYRSFAIANELMQSSEDLTNSCKSYILSGNPIWENKYWEILEIRNGKKARPDGRKIALMDSLKKLGLPDVEFNKLKEAENNSNKLVNTEKTAFNSVKGLFADSSGQFTIKKAPDPKMAERLIVGEKYNSDKNKIMKPIGEFITLINQRSSEELEKRNELSFWMLRIKIILLSIIIVIAVISFFILKERIIKKLDELKSANRTIEEREDQFKKFMDSLPGLAFIKDNDTKVLFSNKGFQTYLGIDPNGIINKTAVEIFPAGFAAKIDDDDRRVLKSGKAETIEELYADRSWSTQKFIIPRVGNPPLLGGISIDITEIRKAEETTRKLFRAVEQSSVSVVITDTKGAIEYVNPKFKNLTGFSLDEVQGQNPRLLKSNYTPDSEYSNLWQTISAGKEWKGEFCNKKKNGEFYWEAASISPIFDNSGNITHYLAIKEDITEKKQIAKALELSEEKYKILFNNSPDAYFLIVDDVYADCNHSAEIMLKTDHSNIIGKKPGFMTLGFTPDGSKSVEVYRAELAKAEKNGKNTFEWVHRRSDGTDIFVEISAAAITLESKPALFTTWRDITKRKLTEKALIENEARLREAQAIGHIGNWEIDLSTHELRGSEEASRIYGMDQIGGSYPLEALQQAVLPDYRAFMDEQLNGLLKGSANYEQEFKIKRLNDGEIRWLYSKAEFIVDSLRGLPRIIGIVQDITDRKLVDEELHKSQTFLYDIIENNGALIYVKDCDGVYRLINKKWEETTGLRRENVIGKSESEIFPESAGQNFRETDLKVIQDGKIQEVEEILETSTGIRYFISIKFPMRGERNEIKGVCGISTEITERKQSEKQLKKYTEELQELNYTKDKFFSIIAHDLKNPFQGLLNLSRILLTDYSILSEEDKISFIKSIEDLSNNTYKLLENLLDWARIQTGRMALTPETFNILAELYPTISLLRQTAVNKGIEFSYSIDQSALIHADKDMLSTIVRNLVTNSIKFTEREGKVVLNVNHSDSHTLFSVSDTGVGIEKENIKKLFRLDKNLKTLGTAKEKGTGLGLHLCKELIEKHNGGIWVESELGKGTTFYFTIPDKL